MKVSFSVFIEKMAFFVFLILLGGHNGKHGECGDFLHSLLHRTTGFLPPQGHNGLTQHNRSGFSPSFCPLLDEMDESAWHWGKYMMLLYWNLCRNRIGGKMLESHKILTHFQNNTQLLLVILLTRKKEQEQEDKPSPWRARNQIRNPSWFFKHCSRFVPRVCAAMIPVVRTLWHCPKHHQQQEQVCPTTTTHITQSPPPPLLLIVLHNPILSLRSTTLRPLLCLAQPNRQHLKVVVMLLPCIRSFQSRAVRNRSRLHLYKNNQKASLSYAHNNNNNNNTWAGLHANAKSSNRKRWVTL